MTSIRYRQALCQHFSSERTGSGARDSTASLQRTSRAVEVPFEIPPAFPVPSDSSTMFFGPGARVESLPTWPADCKEVLVLSTRSFKIRTLTRSYTALTPTEQSRPPVGVAGGQGRICQSLTSSASQNGSALVPTPAWCCHKSDATLLKIASVAVESETLCVHPCKHNGSLLDGPDCSA